MSWIELKRRTRISKTLFVMHQPFKMTNVRHFFFTVAIEIGIVFYELTGCFISLSFTENLARNVCPINGHRYHANYAIASIFEKCAIKLIIIYAEMGHVRNP